MLLIQNWKIIFLIFLKHNYNNYNFKACTIPSDQNYSNKLLMKKCLQFSKILLSFINN